MNYRPIWRAACDRRDVGARVEGQPAEQARTTPDHLLVMARLADGPPVSIEVVGARLAAATPFRFEVLGQTGTLLLEGGAPHGAQSGLLRLSLNGDEQRLDAGPDVEPDTEANVAGLYAALRDNIINATRTTPDFEHTVRMTRLVEAMLSASETGERKRAPEWTCQ